MTREQVMTTVEDVLRGPCGVRAEISEASLLMEELDLDSMGMLALAVELENRLRLKLEEDPDLPPSSVKDVVDLVMLRLGEGT